MFIPAGLPSPRAALPIFRHLARCSKPDRIQLGQSFQRRAAAMQLFKVAPRGTMALGESVEMSLRGHVIAM